MRYECESFVETHEGFEARVRVPAGSAFFRGHFENDPMLPGVALLLLGHELPRVRIPGFGRLTGLQSVRFRKPARPGAQLQFHWRRLAATQLFVKVLSDGAPIAEGTLLLAEGANA